MGLESAESQHALFAQAVLAVVEGDEPRLQRLLVQHPTLAHARSNRGHNAALLHYVAANGVEVQRSPSNAPAIARLLLTAGAEVDAPCNIYELPHYCTPLCLTVTSCVPFAAGVQTALVDVLLDYGSKIDGIDDDGAPLGCALLFGYTRAAERLAERGARVDNVVYAAGLGENETVREMLARGTGLDNIVRRADDRAGRFSFPVARDAPALEVALVVAAMHGRLDTVRLLLGAGVNVDATPYAGQSALHYAAHMGRVEVVDELLSLGAIAGRIDSQSKSTPAEWAAEGGHLELALRLQR